MIGRLKGIVEETGEGWLLLDVGGVGYLVFASASTLNTLPSRGEAARLEIETHVREDHIHLYGFASAAEKEWFALLQSVQGVGAKVALAILSILSPAELTQAVAAQDRAAVGQASGVGPKLAARIVNELKDKVGGMALGAGARGAAPVAPAEGGGALDDAVSALVNLGYRPGEALAAVAKARNSAGADADVQTLIKAGLKELAA